MAVQTREPAGGTALRPARPALHRLRWWHEVLLIAVGYAVYTLIRDTVPAHRDSAFGHARDVQHAESAIGLFREPAINGWLAAHHAMAVVANYWYALAHFVVTIGVAVWVLWRHPQHARPLRIAWYSMNLAALVGFATYPLAPPRLMPGFTDTVVHFGTWGSWGKNGIDSASNQFAAMPSMHVGWSVWCAIVIVALAGPWWVKALGAAYPVLTVGVIVGTANHYLLDVAGGLGALAVGLAVQRLLTGAGPFSDRSAAARPPAMAAATRRAARAVLSAGR